VKNEMMVMKKEDFLGNLKPIFTCLDVYGQQQTPELMMKKERFKKNTRRK
jgi:hypothetical protein